MTTLMRYEGRIVATVGATRIYLAPEVERLPDGDPVLRFVVMMCAYALEMHGGGIRLPYSDHDAARFARTALIDRTALEASSHMSNVELAHHFGVPPDEIDRARQD